MAKYNREQRDRAVDLYIKYEHSAADTIRELCVSANWRPQYGHYFSAA